jgi:CheY-like chemotaxis protein
VAQVPPTILVVDDEAAVREALYDALDLAGYEVSTAANAHEALEKIHVQIPSALICDVRMPGMSGLDLLAALRAEAATRHLPVILLTGLAGDEDIVAGVRAGASMYVTKPLDVSRLLALLAGVAPRPV